MTKAGYRDRRVERGLPRTSEAERAYRRSYVSDPERKRERKRALVSKRFAAIADMKVKMGCADCGYNAHPQALEFDHLPDFEKTESISEMIRRGRSMALILAEIAKCEVVCANCHRVRTYGRRGGLPWQA
jgi:hypothetical protein